MKSYEEKEYELSMLQKLRYPKLKPMVDDERDLLQIRLGCLTVIILILVILFTTVLLLK